jgi:hypothetical protein
MDESNTGKSVLPFKLQQLIGTIAEKKGLGVEDALEYLYSSKLYEKLSTDSPLLWRLSTANLYDLLKTEKLKTKHAQNISSPVLLFLAFCIENYKEHKQIDANEVLFLFRKYGVIEYLTSGFDVLHTQGRDYIMADIDHYIKNHR